MRRFLTSRTAPMIFAVAFAVAFLPGMNASAQTGPIQDHQVGKGNLLVASFGVSNAQGQHYVAGPKQNAIAHDRFWAGQAGKIYDKVMRHKLVNEQLTRRQMLSELDSICNEARVGDTAVIYMCGHGG